MSCHLQQASTMLTASVVYAAGGILPSSAGAAAERGQQWHDSALPVHSSCQVQCVCIQPCVYSEGKFLTYTYQSQHALLYLLDLTTPGWPPPLLEMCSSVCCDAEERPYSVLLLCSCNKCWHFCGLHCFGCRTCMSVLQSEATPGEDEMNPTVKRSGWHPPEDTGLWAIADRVVLEVSCSTHRMFDTANC